jgi:hypothetical protein
MLSLDPELLCPSPEGESVFRTLLGQSMLGKARFFGTSRLYQADDILKDVGTVAELFLRATSGGTVTISLIGGYAFMDGERFLFGAEHAYSLHKEWERAFRQIMYTSPVTVVVDQHTTKLIKRENEIVINRGTSEIVAPLPMFLSSSADAMAENLKLRRTLASELRLRFGMSKCDVLAQLE